MRSLLLCALLLFANAARAADADPALVAAAQKEAQVVWYSTLIVNQILRPMAEAFEQKNPGIRVQYSRATNTVAFRTDCALGLTTANDCFNGDMAEVILYERVLTPSERDAVGAYLVQKYALPIPIPLAPVVTANSSAATKEQNQ